MIKYKADWYDKLVIQVDQFFPSSKLCNNCGYKHEDLTLDIRSWTCPECGQVHDRDINAAVNILKEANRICTRRDYGNQSLRNYGSLEPSKQESPTSTCRRSSNRLFNYYETFFFVYLTHYQLWNIYQEHPTKQRN